MKLPNPFTPILLLALGIHAGLLMLPLSDPDEQTLLPATPEPDSIRISRVSADVPAPTTPSDVGAIAKSSAHTPQPPPAAAGRPASPSPAAQPFRPTPSPTPVVRSPRSTPEVPPLTSPVIPPPAPGANLPPSSPTLTSLTRSATRKLPNTLKQLADWFQQIYTYNPENTTPAEADAALERWIQDLRQATEDPTLTPESLENPILLKYPMDSTKYQRRFVTCLRETPNAAFIGVSFDDTGVPTINPILLRSTGYRFLNQEALEQVQQYTAFPEQTTARAFTILVEIDYDTEACL